MHVDEICTDDGFIALKKDILKKRSLDCDQYKDSYLKRRFAVRMRARGVDTYAGYLHVLAKENSEYDLLMSDLTINVTQFFRDVNVFKALEEDIFPMLIYAKIKNKTPSIKIWSAGCSSGEEPYTVAILLHNLLGEELDHFNVRIIGTDIDEDVLKMANEGKYQPRQVVNVPEEYLHRYFKYDGQHYFISE